MKRFLAYLHTQRRALLVWALTAAIFGAVIALYDLPLEPFGYAAALSAAILAAVLAAGWPAWARRCRELEQLAETQPGRDPALPEPEGGEAGLEAAYQQVLRGQAGQMADRAVEALLAGELDYDPQAHCSGHGHGEGHTCGDHAGGASCGHGCRE